LNLEGWGLAIIARTPPLTVYAFEAHAAHAVKGVFLIGYAISIWDVIFPGYPSNLATDPTEEQSAFKLE
jgi:hypothetical protein